jgi:ABC-type transport system substrate-binding protein
LKRKVQLIFIFLLIGIAFPLIHQRVLAPATDHDTLVIGITVLPFIDIRDMWNHGVWFSYDINLVVYQYMAALGMITPGDSADVLRGIAESWIHNEDLTEWTYTLREGLTFHNGEPIDAKAVEYSLYAWDVAFPLGQNNFSYVQENFPKTHGFNISFPEEDPTGSGREITFHFHSPTPPDHEWTYGSQWKFLVPYGSHGEYTDSTETCESKTRDFFRDPVSAGPYQIKEWVPNDFIILEQFDDWFGWDRTLTSIHGKQYTFPTKESTFKFLHFKVLNSTTDPRKELLLGNIDVIYAEAVWSIDENSSRILTEIDQTEGFSVQWNPVDVRAELGLNVQGNWPTVFDGRGNFPLSESWFRKAVSHAIDRDKLVSEVYQGYAVVSDSIFPADIGKHFPDIDRSDYYDFDQGKSVVESILDSRGYTRLGFAEEQDNRFGYGPYLNETTDQGEPRSRGHHFWMISSDRPINVERSQLIVEDLKKVGIYVDLVIVKGRDYNMFGDPGYLYNDSLPNGDPNYKGSDYDFFAYDWNYGYGFPHTYVGGAYLLPDDSYTNALWYLYGRSINSWFNNNYEVLLAKMRGGYGFLLDLPYADIPPEAPFPAPEVRNIDIQYTEACEDAGELLSEELPFIPLVWTPAITPKNSRVKNFLIDGDSYEFHGAYTFWDPSDNSSSIPTSSGLSSTISVSNPILDYFLLMNMCLILLVYKSKKKY